MPNQDDQNQNVNTQGASNPPVIPTTGQDVMDIPPMITPQESPKPDETVQATLQAENPPIEQILSEETKSGDQGSAAPAFQTQDDSAAIVSSQPKKKFGGGKIIATILGFFLLVGGIAGGVILTQQQQDVREKAKETNCDQGEIECWDGSCAASSSKCPKKPVAPAPAPPAQVGGEGGVVSPYCSSFMNQDCAFGCTPTVGGGTCKPNPNSGGTSGSTGGGYSSCGECQLDASFTTCVNLGACSMTTTTCSGNLGCANGYICSSGSCIPDPAEVAVGGAPIGCNRDCDPADIVCEPPARKECKTTGINGTKWCLIEANSSWCGGSGGGGTTTTTTSSPTASCQYIQAYSTTWTLLTSANLSSLKVNDQVNFCVNGTASEGAFDRARFTINGALQAETTAKRPSSEDYCQLYTIPAGTTAFAVSAQIHHATLGWK